MRKLTLILIVFLFGCSAFYIEKMNTEGISLYTDVVDNQIRLKFTNFGKNDIKLYTPCLTNTLIYIGKDGVKIIPKILFRRGCDTIVFTLKSGENKEFIYPYRVDKLFTLEKGEKYKLKIEYSIFNKGKIKNRIISGNNYFVY